MRKENGAISIFTFLAMVFFLVFIMVAYNNVEVKGKTQLETEEILMDAYKPDVSSSDVLTQMNKGNISDIDDDERALIVKTSDEIRTVSSNENLGKYIFLNGGFYKINEID